MPANWTAVTVSHVQQACNLYDSGVEVPKRMAKSTFLLLNGRSYPAKFIRGLAYRLATGIELDPNTDYAGGEETIRFFATLGLPTSNTTSLPPLPTPTNAPAGTAASPATTLTPSSAKVRTYEPQKQALYDLLRKHYSVVECETKFPWLVVPARPELVEPLAAIWETLHALRGFDTFAVAGQSLRCDFTIPDERLIVEYDERQHFTTQRAEALKLYPSTLLLGFDRLEWIRVCEAIRARDPSPPHRDEQRAFYDSLRDVLAAANGYRLVRFCEGDFDWSGTGAEARLKSALSKPIPVAAGVERTAVSAPSVSGASPAGQERTYTHHPESPFAGFGPQPVRCRWLSADDERNASTAEVIRLVVDENRGCTHWPNHVYQQNVMRDVQAFLGPTRAVVMTPAGMITTDISTADEPPLTMEAAMAGLRADLGLSHSIPSGLEVLLGADGCVPGLSTPLQTVLHCNGSTEQHAIMKLYPTGEEAVTLLGWKACQNEGGVANHLAQCRRISTGAGHVLVLVCNDAGVFSGRSRTNAKDPLRLAIRAHFTEQATALPPVDYVLIATHHQTYTSGNSFQNAASYLAELTGATIVMTMRSPRTELDAVASRFWVRGPRTDRVATLIVEDTWSE